VDDLSGRPNVRKEQMLSTCLYGITGNRPKIQTPQKSFTLGISLKMQNVLLAVRLKMAERKGSVLRREVAKRIEAKIWLKHCVPNL
jgi:hypothetical protein